VLEGMEVCALIVEEQIVSIDLAARVEIIVDRIRRRVLMGEGTHSKIARSLRLLEILSLRKKKMSIIMVLVELLYNLDQLEALIICITLNKTL
jgi:hypothetical protein